MKVYFIYEGKDKNGTVVQEQDEIFKLKVDLPTAWSQSECSKLIDFFVKTLNAKRPSSQVKREEVELRCGGLLLKETDIIGNVVREYNDVYLLHKAAAVERIKREGEILCTNFGCGKYYVEEENNDTACHFHAKGPVFHDLEKYWSCCEGKKAFDWEQFQSIPTCQVGRHDTKNKPFAFPKEEIANIPLSAGQVQQLSAGPASTGPATTGPREFEGAVHAQSEPQKIIDGKARCRNFNCGKEFVVAENNETACQFHKEGPVFWDTYKYWKCCPDKKRYEFEDFVKIPGCCTGPHKL
ncbi:rar1 [Angomonas deanei]|nr:rar1 [Angomonas deanei]|eukprot:EPY26753.1 rar1 [Angomonas deanei]